MHFKTHKGITRKEKERIILEKEAQERKKRDKELMYLMLSVETGLPVSEVKEHFEYSVHYAFYDRERLHQMELRERREAELLRRVRERLAKQRLSYCRRTNRYQMKLTKNGLVRITVKLNTLMLADLDLYALLCDLSRGEALSDLLFDGRFGKGETGFRGYCTISQYTRRTANLKNVKRVKRHTSAFLEIRRRHRSNCRKSGFKRVTLTIDKVLLKGIDDFKTDNKISRSIAIDILLGEAFGKDINIAEYVEYVKSILV